MSKGAIHSLGGRPKRPRTLSKADVDLWGKDFSILPPPPPVADDVWPTLFKTWVESLFSIKTASRSHQDRNDIVQDSRLSIAK